MRAWNFGATAVAFSAAFMLAGLSPSQASTPSSTSKSSHASAHSSLSAGKSRADSGKTKGGIQNAVFHGDSGISSRLRHTGRGSKVAFRSRGGSYGGISCVPFARAATGIELKGNAANWWDAASGVYARGDTPEPGSVMNFRATGHMRLGHVAVVTSVLNSRLVEIDHANWAGPGAGRGGVSRGIPVMDVSERNDWSEVRVGLGHTGGYGSVYPTYGFIYDRPDRGGFTMARHGGGDDEVAEAPDSTAQRGIDAASRGVR